MWEPATVPSLCHSSRPWLPSSAANQRPPVPLAHSSLGVEDAVPGRRSKTLVPATVPSVRQISSPNVVLYERNQTHGPDTTSGPMICEFQTTNVPATVPSVLQRFDPPVGLLCTNNARPPILTAPSTLMLLIAVMTTVPSAVPL